MMQVPEGYEVAVGKDGIFSVSGKIQDKAWVAYGQTLEEALSHARVSHKVIKRKLEQQGDLADDNRRPA